MRDLYESLVHQVQLLNGVVEMMAGAATKKDQQEATGLLREGLLRWRRKSTRSWSALDKGGCLCQQEHDPEPL